MSAVIVGSTGLVGSFILKNLVENAKFTNISAYSRRKLPIESTKITAIESTDTETWPSKLPQGASILFSGLGTTARIAGGLANQRKIDLDLNLELAKAAKESGVQIYVLISSSSASASSLIPYSKMKGELEDGIQALGFRHTIILQPGLIIGTREARDSRPGEYAARTVASALSKIGGGILTNFWSQDANVIATAAVNSSLQCLEGAREPGVWILSQSEILEIAGV